MAKVVEFYSDKRRDVYHDRSECAEGNSIPRKERSKGTSGLPNCKYCRDVPRGGSAVRG